MEIKKIEQLRRETGISIKECKRALEEAGGDVEKAREILKRTFGEISGKFTERETKEGIVECYVHAGKRLGVMIKLLCESDFVARSKEFQELAHELCLQICAIDPEEFPIMTQRWIRDETKTIKELIDEYIVKFGENIVLQDYCRFKI